jgi:hypothetical protein
MAHAPVKSPKEYRTVKPEVDHTFDEQRMKETEKAAAKERAAAARQPA